MLEFVDIIKWFSLNWKVIVSWLPVWLPILTYVLGWISKIIYDAKLRSPTKMHFLVNKLIDMRIRLRELWAFNNYQKDMHEFLSITQFLERIIYRIYPEKDAQQLKSKMYGILEENQLNYRDIIELKIRVINTILSEHALFGFDDFKPIKEESEYQIGSEKFGGFFRKKKSK